MFAQFFGAYLLNKGAVTREQLTSAIACLSEANIKLGTLAMHQGLMTASEVDEICFLQTREDKKFGEIAVERGYLSEETVSELLHTQTPDYLLLGQMLVDQGALTNAALEDLLVSYQNDTEIFNPGTEDIDQTKQLIERFFKISNQKLNEESILYMNLLFNNLTRFIGSDFSLLAPVSVTEYPLDYCVCQKINGPISMVTRLNMPEDIAILFASRYAKIDFQDFDEYVTASLEDFLNLHNGLFSVNMSNSSSIELTLEPPFNERVDILTLPPDTSYVLPIIYPFGTLHIILSLSE